MNFLSKKYNCTLFELNMNKTYMQTTNDHTRSASSESVLSHSGANLST